MGALYKGSQSLWWGSALGLLHCCLDNALCAAACRFLQAIQLVPALPTRLLPMLVQNIPHKLRDRNTQCLYMRALLLLAEGKVGEPGLQQSDGSGGLGFVWNKSIRFFCRYNRPALYHFGRMAFVSNGACVMVCGMH